MKKWCTEIKAIDPTDGIIKSWGGPNIPAISFRDAEMYCQMNGLGYCKVIGELIAEIPCKKGTYDPDFENMINYEQINNN